MQEKFKYSATADEEQAPCLHDCIATEIRLEGSELFLEFPDGFWLPVNDSRNPNPDMHKTGPETGPETGPARAVLSLGYPEPATNPNDAIAVELFHSFRLFRGVSFTICRYPNAEKLIEKVNNGKWELEFVRKYPEPSGCLIDCCFRAKKKHMRCYLHVDCRQIRYFWN